MQKKLFKDKSFGLYENVWLPWQPIMRLSRMGDISTKSITSQGLVTPANGYVPEGKRTRVCRIWLSGDKMYLLCRSMLSRSSCGAWKLSNDRTSTGHVTGKTHVNRM